MTANVTPHSQFTSAIFVLHSHSVEGMCHSLRSSMPVRVKSIAILNREQRANFLCVLGIKNTVLFLKSLLSGLSFCVAGNDKWKCTVSDNEWALQPIHSSKCNCNMNTRGIYSPSDNIYILIKHLDGLAILCSYALPIWLQVRIGINNWFPMFSWSVKPYVICCHACTCPTITLGLCMALMSDWGNLFGFPNPWGSLASLTKCTEYVKFKTRSVCVCCLRTSAKSIKRSYAPWCVSVKPGGEKQ